MASATLGEHLVSTFTHNPSHSKPHADPSPQFLTDEKRQDAPTESSQVVYCHNNALEGTARVPESAAPVFVAHDA